MKTYTQLYDCLQIDCIIYRNINSKHDTKTLQEDLDTLSEWETKWQMKFNPDKSYLLQIPSSSRSEIITKYVLGKYTLQETKTHPYLGV